MSKKFRYFSLLMIFIVFISIGALSAADVNNNSSQVISSSSVQTNVNNTVSDVNTTTTVSNSSSVLGQSDMSNSTTVSNSSSVLEQSVNTNSNDTKDSVNKTTLNNQTKVNSLVNSSVSIKSSSTLLKATSTPTSFSISQIVSAAKTVRAYYAANGKLPSTVTIGSVKVCLSQFLYYESRAISQLNSGNTANIAIVRSLSEPSSPNRGDSVNGRLTKSAYVDSATRTYKFILNYNQGPNYSTTTVGRVSYNRLIEAFSAVLDYYGTNKQLPSYVTVKYNSKTTTPTSSTTVSSFTVNQIVTAARTVRAYYAANGKLPSTVTIGSVKVSLSQFLYYESRAISQLNSGNTANIAIVRSLSEPSSPNSGDSVNGRLTKSAYVDSATRTYKFILNYNQGPNYSTTTVGRVSYNRLIEVFSVVLDYYGTNKQLPSYVTVKYNSKTTTPGNIISDNNKTNNTNSSSGNKTNSTVNNKEFTIDQIVSAAKTVKAYYDLNGKLPSTVTIGSVKLSLSQFLYYQSKAISQLNSGNTANIPIISKTFNEPSSPNSGDSISGKLAKSAYVDSATRTYKFILNYNQGPNYSTTTLGRVSYNKLIETFCEVLVYYGNNKALPTSVPVKTTRVGNYTYMVVPSSSKYLSGNVFAITLKDSWDNIVANQKISFKINGIVYTNTTNSKGIAYFVIPELNGNYAINYYYTNSNSRLSSSGSKTISIVNNITSLIGTNLTTTNYSNVKYSVTLKDCYGNAIANQVINFKITGISSIYTAKTNSNGIASIVINLPTGTYTVTYSFAGNSNYPKSNGMSTIIVKNKISSISIDSLIDSANWVKNQYSIISNGTKYTFNKYGVSSDGKYIMAIGRPSASGELSKYGYTFYRSVFYRVCPICGSTNLFWSIFWAGNEYDNYGTFPATGNKEGGSAEGHIFCADCDADFSCIDGLNHVSGSTLALKKLVDTIKVTKSQAYVLLNGSMQNVDIVSSEGKLPTVVNIEGASFSLCQYFYYVCRAISQLSVGNTSAMSFVTFVDEPSNPTSGDSISGASLSKAGYVDSATRTYKYILNNLQGPNYSTTTVGRIPYDNLVKLFTEVLIYYGKNNKLPDSITVNT
ncbi:Ig-like domain-containing protein [Methanobrevibacter wolinii]|uniref:Ig-like domain-containing protein n=1 Tax=Methanobrevibacter wolinii TaxID=190977 RepID=UPI000A4C73A3|nr:Ig-like domain-containing protein [Methanobrevibacter wolinii]